MKAESHSVMVSLVTIELLINTLYVAIESQPFAAAPRIVSLKIVELKYQELPICIESQDVTD